jgi:tRNA A37 threonylcarbamoyladenosine dehydratase
MDCASGFGAATFITGVFGFVAVADVVRVILEEEGEHAPAKPEKSSAKK